MTEFEVKIDPGPGPDHETEGYLPRLVHFSYSPSEDRSLRRRYLTSNHASMVVGREGRLNFESPKRVVIIGEDQNVRETTRVI